MHHFEVLMETDRMPSSVLGIFVLGVALVIEIVSGLSLVLVAAIWPAATMVTAALWLVVLTDFVGFVASLPDDRRTTDVRRNRPGQILGSMHRSRER